jgi:hypothetical protein
VLQLLPLLLLLPLQLCHWLHLAQHNLELDSEQLLL